MIQFRNGWFHATDLVNAASVIHTTARSEPTKWLENGIACKYVEIRIDMRTGDFILRDNDGNRLPNETIAAMFPALCPIEEFK